MGSLLSFRIWQSLSAVCGTVLFLGVDTAMLPTSASASEPIEVRSVENRPDRPSVLLLRDGSRFATTLFEVRVLGVLRAVRKVPYLVLAGRGCRECDAGTSIYIHSVSDGPMADESRQPRYAYPGRETWYEDRKTVLYEARTFLGDCLPGYENALVWHERGRTQEGTWKARVFVVSIRQDELAETSLDKKVPHLSESLQRVAAGRCRELRGITRSSEP